MTNYHLRKTLDVKRDTESGDLFFEDSDQHWHIGMLIYVIDGDHEFIVRDLTPGKVWVYPCISERPHE